MADWYFRNRQPNGLHACPGCRNLVRKGEEFCPFCARRLGPESGVRALVKRLFRRPDSVTRILLGAIIAVFLLQLAVEMLLPPEVRRGSGGGVFSLLQVSTLTYIMLGSNDQALVMAGHQYWRWLTYCFLHIGLLHILFNSWALRDLGRLAENMWGHRALFGTFVLTGIFAGGTSFVWGAVILGEPRMSAGASGAICGILGLFLGAYRKGKFHVGEQLGAVLVRWAVFILVFGLVAGADNAAHIGGMVSGAILGYFLPPGRSTETPDRDAKIWTALAVLSLVLTLVCFAFAIAFALQGPEHAQRAAVMARMALRM